MSTQVVRIEGYNKGSLGTIGRECDRAEGINHRNQDIDPERSSLNVSYKDAPNGFTSEYANIVAALNASGKETKKGVAFEGMIITADLPFFEHLGYEQGKFISKELKAFFDRSYEFAKTQIGYQGTDKNILSAKIHLDEKTPHLHLYYIPITEKWQTKIYAKGTDGKVLRTENGTPIQAKDANGKTLYEQHEDKTTPKLSRTEFWRVRGGQSSYRMMQDQFQKQVGKQYGLDRGEVGSDRKYKRTAVYKQEQLTAETQKLTEKVKPFRQLKAGIDEVEAAGKTILPGLVAVKKKDLNTLKEQAKSYAANRSDIKHLRRRESAVGVRELEADRREVELEDQRKRLESKKRILDREIAKQPELNEINRTLESQFRAMESQCRRAEDDFHVSENQNIAVRKALDYMSECYKNAIQAIGMTLYENKEGYHVGMPEKAKSLLEAVWERAEKHLEWVGAIDKAEKVKKYISIAPEIEKNMKSERTIQKNRGFGISR